MELSVIVFDFLTAFVGLNLFQFGFDGLCPFGVVVENLGVPEE